MNRSAIFVLEDGTKFYGQSVGINSSFFAGEVVFNTSMTGYQEIITDPSYYHQIVVFLYPHIGNVGINNNDVESNSIYVKGLVVRDISLISNNFRSEETFSCYLKKNNIVAISNIDTRKLAHILRIKGTQNGCIFTGNNPDYNLALKIARNTKKLKGKDLVKTVTTKKIYTWTEKTWIKSTKKLEQINKKFCYKVIAYDYGIKYNTLRMLSDRGCDITVVPAQMSAENVLNLQPDGIFLSNGPGDPEPCHYAIKAIKIFLKKNIPIFGICLGHQLLALAIGATTIKMKIGHHGSNHPVKDLKNDRVMITSQNHGFTVNKENLPNNICITHISLFDKTIQGIHHLSKPAFGFQGHPEGSPGPQDSSSLFDYFIELMKNYCKKKKT
ncbi:glutamine-hydrolyzing carbamoyl-phosphate synthase small subunit [Candidatus Tachikawaea gelatinosa]|uniref:Carbamoyl phosphate synthase small chain n=1 Tax=Candidatus Tachikawaea gelatinosa TaxID=1410383 RepID=A0A090ASG2_9ENTR|nr:glutamine-hydrolyzing carbamoyl-phosphate synthase small subunit [Candidatus Tachikawaea gelatinosa]BAP58800.1 carbamoyl-phosphate synthase small chain [Candidatus Tachikawaea gelatinosa]